MCINVLTPSYYDMAKLKCSQNVISLPLFFFFIVFPIDISSTPSQILCFMLKSFMLIVFSVSQSIKSNRIGQFSEHIYDTCRCDELCLVDGNVLLCSSGRFSAGWWCFISVYQNNNKMDTMVHHYIYDDDDDVDIT